MGQSIKILNTADLVTGVWKCREVRLSFPVTLHAPLSRSESFSLDRELWLKAEKKKDSVAEQQNETSGPLCLPFNSVPNLWYDPQKTFYPPQASIVLLTK